MLYVPPLGVGASKPTRRNCSNLTRLTPGAAAGAIGGGARYCRASHRVAAIVVAAAQLERCEAPIARLCAMGQQPERSMRSSRSRTARPSRRHRLFYLLKRRAELPTSPSVRCSIHTRAHAHRPVAHHTDSRATPHCAGTVPRLQATEGAGWASDSVAARGVARRSRRSRRGCGGVRGERSVGSRS